MSTTIPTIALVRQTSLLTDALVQALVPALQMQVNRDWKPHWNSSANIVSVTQRAADVAQMWQLALVDTSDEADALGYHDVTAAGLPCGIIAVGDCLRDGLAWTVTVSHELLEMLGDPDITAVRQEAIKGVNYDYAYESCDACEDDSFAYPILGHHVSDFVFPSWFDQSAPPPYDYRRLITAPLQLLEGGYIGERQLPNGQWTQKMAAQHGPRQAKGPHSRTMRRFNRP